MQSTSLWVLVHLGLSDEGKWRPVVLLFYHVLLLLPSSAREVPLYSRALSKVRARPFRGEDNKQVKA